MNAYRKHNRYTIQIELSFSSTFGNIWTGWWRH